MLVPCLTCLPGHPPQLCLLGQKKTIAPTSHHVTGAQAQNKQLSENKTFLLDLKPHTDRKQTSYSQCADSTKVNVLYGITLQLLACSDSIKLQLHWFGIRAEYMAADCCSAAWLNPGCWVASSVHHGLISWLSWLHHRKSQQVRGWTLTAWTTVSCELHSQWIKTNPTPWCSQSAFTALSLKNLSEHRAHGLPTCCRQLYFYFKMAARVKFQNKHVCCLQRHSFH